MSTEWRSGVRARLSFVGVPLPSGLRFLCDDHRFPIHSFAGVLAGVILNTGIAKTTTHVTNGAADGCPCPIRSRICESQLQSLACLLSPIPGSRSRIPQNSASSQVHGGSCRSRSISIRCQMSTAATIHTALIRMVVLVGHFKDRPPRESHSLGIQASIYGCRAKSSDRCLRRTASERPGSPACPRTLARPRTPQPRHHAGLYQARAPRRDRVYYLNGSDGRYAVLCFYNGQRDSAINIPVATTANTTMILSIAGSTAQLKLTRHNAPHGWMTEGGIFSAR